MASFDTAYNKVKKYEGGYNPSDAGAGETYAGINRKWNPDWPGWAMIDDIKRKGSIKRGTVVEELNSSVRNFFATKKWPLIKGNDIKSQALANYVFDFFVTSETWAIQKLQEAINETGPYKVTVDKVLGNLTLDAANNSDQNKLLENYHKQRVNFYNSINKTGYTTADRQSNINRAMDAVKGVLKKSYDAVKNNPGKTTTVVLFSFGLIALISFLRNSNNG